MKVVSKQTRAELSVANGSRLTKPQLDRLIEDMEYARRRSNWHSRTRLKVLAAKALIKAELYNEPEERGAALQYFELASCLRIRANQLK